MPPNIVEFTSLHSFTLSHPPNQEQCVCVCVCLLSIEIQTAGWIAMKFGMEVVLEGRKVLGGSTLYPGSAGMGHQKGVQGASGASAVHFGKN